MKGLHGDLLHWFAWYLAGSYADYAYRNSCVYSIA